MVRVLTGEVVAEALGKPGRPGCRLALGRPESEITERPGAQTGLAKRAGAWNSETCELYLIDNGRTQMLLLRE